MGERREQREEHFFDVWSTLAKSSAQFHSFEAFPPLPSSSSDDHRAHCNFIEEIYGSITFLTRRVKSYLWTFFLQNTTFFETLKVSFFWINLNVKFPFSRYEIVLNRQTHEPLCAACRDWTSFAWFEHDFQFHFSSHPTAWNNARSWMWFLCAQNEFSDSVEKSENRFGRLE